MAEGFRDAVAYYGHLGHGSSGRITDRHVAQKRGRRRQKIAFMPRGLGHANVALKREPKKLGRSP